MAACVMPIAQLSGQGSLPTRNQLGWLDRLFAKRTAFSENCPTFQVRIKPRSVGSVENGRLLVSGEMPVPGLSLQVSGDRIWKTRIIDPEQVAWLHGFTWLDDLAAFRDADAVSLARNWVFGWIDVFGSGQGPGWTPEVSARRLICLVHNAYVVLAMRCDSERETFSRSIAHHAEFLEPRWQSKCSGIARIEALTGLLYAHISLDLGNDRIIGAADSIADECMGLVDEDGSIVSRNPEELLHLATFLRWARFALLDAGIKPRPEHVAAVERVGLVLRSLCHFNGVPPRFHGGHTVPMDYVVQAIAEAGEHSSYCKRMAMGFARLSSERTSVIVDAAPSLSGWASRNSHASTLAFEMVAGESPIVVNCGSGKGIAPKFAWESRETRAHSAVEVNDSSSSRFAIPRFGQRTGDEIVVYSPKGTRVVQWPDTTGNTFAAEHDGYVALYGLTHLRRLDLGMDGLSLWGEDTLWARSSGHRVVYERAARSLTGGIPFAIRFHLYPTTEVELDENGQYAALVLSSGEVWTFEFEGDAFLELEESAYFDKTARVAYHTPQIVLRSRVVGGSAQVHWVFEHSG